MITLKSLKPEELAAAQSIYDEAFPPEERAPFEMLTSRIRIHKATLLGAYQNDRLIGFVYFAAYQNLIYLFYFAIAKAQRGKGFGSDVLNALQQMYPEKTIFLAREQLDPMADNYQQRVKRREFYIHCGLKDLPLEILEGDNIFDVMATAADVSRAGYLALMNQWIGEEPEFTATIDLRPKKQQAK